MSGNSYDFESIAVAEAPVKKQKKLRVKKVKPSPRCCAWVSQHRWATAFLTLFITGLIVIAIVVPVLVIKDEPAALAFLNLNMGASSSTGSFMPSSTGIGSNSSELN